MSDEFHLERFGRHVPNILKRQLIANLAEQFVSQESLPDDYCGSYNNVPSVSHFHGTLLFVDISGFTILSQRLPVDDLRTQINSYFKKIIDIVDEYGGDVIKFAGDALFIVWQTTQSEDEEIFSTNIQQAGLRALRCGVDIIAKCSNYPVPLTKAKTSSPASHTELTTVSETDAISKIVLETRNAAPTLNSANEVEYTYLNVHAGLSIGRMTGIDIGALDRWEFFIIGQPLHDVAEAEASAEKGELVFTAVAHDLLCCAALPPSEVDKEVVLKENEELQPCGCVKNAGGCFRVATRRVPYFDKVLDPDGEDDLDRELHFYEDVMRHSLEAFAFVKDEVIAKVHAYRDKFAQDLSMSAKLLLSTHHTNGEQEELTAQGSAKLLLTNQNIELTVREEESLHNFFMRWISDCLKNDFARHVHEADRIQFGFRRVKRTDIVQQYFDDQLALNRRRSDPSVPAVASDRGSIDMTFHRSRQNTQTTASSGSSPSNSASASTSSSGSSNFVSKIRSLAQKQSLRDRSRAKHERTLRIDSGLNGELRNVIVLFIAIHGEPDMAQPIPHRPNLPNKFTFTAPKCFNFAQSYCIASEGDAKLLAHYLACIDVIVRSLKDQGGQLRQFIVDDKGTVSIGTFGLRGSTNVDNAAAAIEAAMQVVHGLQNLGLNASVGITAGPAYCGIVGSLRRHEYAVMGPSVNLSARLMGKAKRGEILCDASIRRQDRSHHFHHVGEVQAKGFAEPVPIYKPSSTRASIMMDASLLPSMLDVTTPSAANLTGLTPHTVRLYSDGGGEHTRGQSSKLEVRDMHLYGRDAEIERAYSVIFDAMRNNPDGKSSLPDVESTTPAHRAIDGARFDNTKECVGTSLNGSSGIGKSAILEYFFHIAKDLRSLHGCNVAPFYDISSSLDGREPYKGWKTIFRHIFARMSRFRDVQVPEQSNDKAHEKLRDKWFRGATRLVRDLPASVQEALPLLSAAHIIPGIPETPEIAALSGAVKLKKLGELLEAMILEFPRVTGDLVVILLDDVHLADAFSLRLFISILRHGRGINFLMTWNEDMEKAMSEDQKLIIKENEEIYQDLVKSEKLVEIDLNPLSFESLKSMTTGVLLRENIIVRNDAIFERLADITGGNPLYAYELAKAVVDKYQATDHHGANDGDEVMLTIIDSFKAHRVEEVIFYRMDRLEAKTQMLLKMASVACASGTSKGFSLEMIATMLKGNYEAFGGDFLDAVVDVFFEAEETKRIMKTLSVLVKSLIDAGEFLKIVHGRNRGSFSSSEKSIDIRPPTIDDLMALEPEALSAENAEDKIYEEYKDMFFDFKIGLERNMIYELMLEEQKESLHDRVATFLEKNNAVREHRMMLSSNDLLEEAFHWERAKVWTNALTCYYRAATILEGLGAFQGSYRYYASGFRCFTSLQKVMGENLLSWVNCDDPVRLISLMMRIPHQGLETLVTVEECAEYVQYRHAIYRVVSGDEALLLTIVQTITKFAQGAATLESNPQVTLTLFHEALVIVFFTWKHRYLQDLYSGRLQEVVTAAAVKQATTTSTGRSGLSKATSRKQSTGDDDDHEEASEETKKPSSSSATEITTTTAITAASLRAHEPASPGNNRSNNTTAAATEPHHTNSMLSTRSSASWNTQLEKADMAQFGLADIQLVFPILSGMAALYRMRRVPDDDRRSKESQFYDAMVLFASLSSENHEHQLQAMALLYQLAIETENYTEADSLVERIRETYNHEKYSPRLVEVYGNDRIPFTIALHAQSLILLGKLPMALQLMEDMIALLPQMEHLHSMGILAITLSTGLIVVGRVEDACRVFHHYYSYEQSKPIEVYSFFRDVNPLLATWHNLHMQTLDNAAREKEAFDAVSEQLLHHQSNMMTGHKPLCLVESEEIIDKVVQKGFYFSGETTKRPLLYDALMSFGCAVEYVAAEILSMVALSRTKYLFEQLLPASATDATTVDDATRAQCAHLLQDIPRTMQLALEYVALGIEQTRASNKLKFPFLLSVLAKVKIMLQVDAFHDRCRDFVHDHAAHWATALIAEHVPALTPDEEMTWSKTICATLSDIEEKGRQYQMPFISFASVLLADVIFGGSCANVEAAVSSSMAMMGGGGADSSTIVDPATTVASTASGKTRSDMGNDAVGLTSKVAEAAMQLSGVDMTMVKVLEESLPHFWCGNFNRRFKARPPMDIADAAADAVAAVAAVAAAATETKQ